VKRALFAVVVLAAVLLGARYYQNSYAPVEHYKKFAEEILHRRYDAAAGLTDGLSATDLEKKGSQEHIGAGPPMFQALFPSRYAIESSDVAADGTVTLHAVQTVLFNPVGVESAVRPAMYAKLNQTVSLRKTSSGWKVTSFENQFASMDSMSSR
jgi:hypothetical protein